MACLKGVFWARCSPNLYIHLPWEVFQQSGDLPVCELFPHRSNRGLQGGRRKEQDILRQQGCLLINQRSRFKSWRILHHHLHKGPHMCASLLITRNQSYYLGKINLGFISSHVDCIVDKVKKVAKLRWLGLPRHTLTYFALTLANDLVPLSRKTLLAAREILNARIFNPLLYLLTRGNNVASNKLTAVLHNIFENFAVLNPHGEEISYEGTDLAIRCE